MARARHNHASDSLSIGIRDWVGKSSARVSFWLLHPNGHADKCKAFKASGAPGVSFETDGAPPASPSSTTTGSGGSKTYSRNLGGASYGGGTFTTQVFAHG